MTKYFTLNYWTFLIMLAIFIGLFGLFIWWADKNFPAPVVPGDFCIHERGLYVRSDSSDIS